MNTYTGLQIPTPILRELLNFLHSQNSDLDPSEAATQAIRAWLDDMRRKVLMDKDQEPDGYFWKNVFLPNGTRIQFVGKASSLGFAHIVGGQFVYKGVPMSPNQYAALASESTRNAWRDLTVRLPGEPRPKPAFILRREQGGRPARRLIGKSHERPTDAQLLPLPDKPARSTLVDMPEIPAWVMNNRRKNCKCLGDTMFED